MKRLKLHFIVVLCTYSVIYAAYTFITWSLVNPVQWIIDLPKQTDTVRGSILAVVLTFNFMIYVLINDNRIKDK